MTDQEQGPELDYESDLAIDINALDYEWVRQASLAQKYGAEVANAIYDRDLKKKALKLKSAELDLDIRQSWTEWGFQTKPTETAIANTILADEEVQKLDDELIELNSEVNRLTDIRNDFEHKRVALEYLSRLFLAGYFADPKIPAAAQTAYSDHGKESLMDDVDKSLKRRKNNGKK